MDIRRHFKIWRVVQTQYRHLSIMQEEKRLYSMRVAKTAKNSSQQDDTRRVSAELRRRLPPAVSQSPSLSSLSATVLLELRRDTTTAAGCQTHTPHYLCTHAQFLQLTLCKDTMDLTVSWFIACFTFNPMAGGHSLHKTHP